MKLVPEEIRDVFSDDRIRKYLFSVPEKLISTNPTPELEAERKQFLISRHDVRTADVQAVIPADRLIVLQVSEGWSNPGWSKLSDKFDCKIPVGTEFPRSNSRQKFFEYCTPKTEEKDLITFE